MQTIITYVSPLQQTKNNSDAYHLVAFKLADGSTARTFICPGYKNYPRWKNLLRVGQKVSGLIEQKPGVFSADSDVRAVI
jgi:hypothetical protein